MQQILPNQPKECHGNVNIDFHDSNLKSEILYIYFVKFKIVYIQQVVQNYCWFQNLLYLPQILVGMEGTCIDG